MHLVCYSLLNGQNMSVNNSEKKLVTYNYYDTSDVAKSAAEVVQERRL